MRSPEVPEGFERLDEFLRLQFALVEPHEADSARKEVAEENITRASSEAPCLVHHIAA